MGLKEYPKLADRCYLLQAFQLGFRILFEGPHVLCLAHNCQSVKGLAGIVWEKIVKELQEGRVLGPFAFPSVLTLQVSLLGVVPKKAPGKYQLNNHLSYPQDDSVNDCIPDKLCSYIV